MNWKKSDLENYNRKQFERIAKKQREEDIKTTLSRARLANMLRAVAEPREEGNNPNSESCRPPIELKRSPSNESLAKNGFQKVNSGRVKIIYSVFRARLCDPDNLFLKYHTDALRYEKLIKDDRDQDIEIEVHQFKSKEEYVLIELIYP